MRIPVLGIRKTLVKIGPGHVRPGTPSDDARRTSAGPQGSSALRIPHAQVRIQIRVYGPRYSNPDPFFAFGKCGSLYSSRDPQNLTENRTRPRSARHAVWRSAPAPRRAAKKQRATDPACPGPQMHKMCGPGRSRSARPNAIRTWVARVRISVKEIRFPLFRIRRSCQ